MKEFHTLEDFNFKDKTVLLRVDVNCPLDKETKASSMTLGSGASCLRSAS